MSKYDGWFEYQSKDIMLHLLSNTARSRPKIQARHHPPSLTWDL